MKVPSLADSFEVLVLQAGDDGRGPVLFGDSMQRARTMLRPFMIGNEFPDVYLEFPLIGEPFLDVTVLYDEFEPGMRVDSPAASGTEAMIDWFASARADRTTVCCGFELDLKREGVPAAAVHFQPRTYTDMVAPFCEAVGEPERATLYLNMADRMPEGWPLSFFGMFRGRAGSPLRVCGYINDSEKRACVENPSRVTDVFAAVGFEAYDEPMVHQITQLMAVTPGTVDFQFDVYPDGSLSSTFAIDAQFDIEQPEAVLESFTHGPGARVMGLLEQWGAADGRWRLGAEAAFARSIPVELPDGSFGRYAFTLMPQWVKARWINGELQQAKLYHLAHAGILEEKSESKGAGEGESA